MKRAVLLRFHRRLPVCRNRIGLLRLFNPSLSIFGLYGGPAAKETSFRRGLGDIDHFYSVAGQSSEWKWRHGDLAVRQWYREAGRSLAFDVLHVVEWDLLFLDSLANIFRDVPADSLGLAGLVPLRSLGDGWSWTSREPFKSEWEKLLRYGREELGFAGEPMACIAGGAVLPRGFLEKYAAREVPEWGNDELRMPLFGAALGHEPVDTGFYRWNDPSLLPYFNIEIEEIREDAIRMELARDGGRRVFHPCRRIFCPMQRCGGLYNAALAASALFRRLMGKGS